MFNYLLIGITAIAGLLLIVCGWKYGVLYRDIKKLYRSIKSLGMRQTGKHIEEDFRTGYGNKIAQKINDFLNYVQRRIKEARSGERVQQALVAQSKPKLDGVGLETFYRPATEMGGDAFDWIEVNDRIYWFLIDVSGHDTGAAVLSGSFLGSFWASVKNEISLPELAKKINQALEPKIRLDHRRFVGYLGYFDQSGSEKKIHFINFAYPSPFLETKQRGITELDLEDQRFGDSLNGDWQKPPTAENVKTVPLAKNKARSILFASDALRDVVNKSKNEIFDVDRIKSAISDHPPSSSNGQKTVRYLVSRADDFGTFNDDLSIVCWTLQWRGNKNGK